MALMEYDSNFSLTDVDLQAMTTELEETLNTAGDVKKVTKHALLSGILPKAMKNLQPGNNDTNLAHSHASLAKAVGAPGNVNAAPAAVKIAWTASPSRRSSSAPSARSSRCRRSTATPRGPACKKVKGVVVVM